MKIKSNGVKISANVENGRFHGFPKKGKVTIIKLNSNGTIEQFTGTMGQIKPLLFPSETKKSTGKTDKSSKSNNKTAKGKDKDTPENNSTGGQISIA